jgi:para-aminobenzoate synthetase component 1
MKTIRFDNNSVQAQAMMNSLGAARTPFLFILDFDLQQPIVVKLEEAEQNNIFYDIGGRTNTSSARKPNQPLHFQKYPIPFQRYEVAFQEVSRHLYEGNTYLTNLTFPTRLECNYSLRDIYDAAQARFKLLVADQFVVFSPEIFVRIEGTTISSFPMKGTIDASLPNARERILADKKEEAEHVTIVDLIRNDLSMVAHNVRVESFRYVEEIHTHEKTLLQVSSRIVGELPDDFHKHLGDIFYSLLPAGSVTGAPKKKTVEIIKSVEQYDRGYYTGVFGYYDGSRVESGVMIRFIENNDGTLYYKSGGGITAQSNAAQEYQELIDKVYVPLG